MGYSATKTDHTPCAIPSTISGKLHSSDHATRRHSSRPIQWNRHNDIGCETPKQAIHRVRPRRRLCGASEQRLDKVFLVVYTGTVLVLANSGTTYENIYFYRL